MKRHIKRVPAPFLLLVGWLVLAPPVGKSQEPAGLAASALNDPSFSWVRAETPGFRVYFVPGSYAHAHRDSLLARLPSALARARTLIDAPGLAGPIDLFFVENRARLAELAGENATGFAEPSTRTVLLVTHPEWRAFERHEIMHVVAEQSWGPPGPRTEWLQEGLAQSAEEECAGYSNADVLQAVTLHYGWIPLEALRSQFRAQPDLRAYLQAAVFVDYLRQRYGLAALRTLWRQGTASDSMIDRRVLSDVEGEWRRQFRGGEIAPDDLARIEARGCG